jgi:hypothetical protein
MSQIKKKWIGDHQVDSTKIDPNDYYIAKGATLGTLKVLGSSIFADMTVSNLIVDKEVISHSASDPALQITSTGGDAIYLDGNNNSIASQNSPLVLKTYLNQDIEIAPSSGTTFITGNASISGTIDGKNLDCSGYLRVINVDNSNVPPLTLPGNAYFTTEHGSGIMIHGDSSNLNYVTAQHDTFNNQTGFLLLEGDNGGSVVLGDQTVKLDAQVTHLFNESSVYGTGLVLENGYGGTPSKWSLSAGGSAAPLDNDLHVYNVDPMDDTVLWEKIRVGAGSTGDVGVGVVGSSEGDLIVYNNASVGVGSSGGNLYVGVGSSEGDLIVYNNASIGITSGGYAHFYGPIIANGQTGITISVNISGTTLNFENGILYSVT